MKFFNKLKKETVKDVLPNEERSTNVSLNDTLDYFGEHGAVGKSIVDNQRQVVNGLGERIGSISSLDFDMEMNKELIRSTAMNKYGTSQQDLSLMDTTWFPRIKNKIRRKNNKMDDDSSDNESVISYGSVGSANNVLVLARSYFLARWSQVF